MASTNSSSASTTKRPASWSKPGWSDWAAGALRQPRQVGHQVLDLALCLGREGQVDALGQLVEGQPARREVLPQLGHRGVALCVPDAQVIPAVAGHAPPGYQLFTRLPRVRIVF